MENDNIINNESQPEDNNSALDYSPGNQTSNYLEVQKSTVKNNLFVFFKTIIFILISIVIALFFVVFVLYIIPVLQKSWYYKGTSITNVNLKKDAAYKKQMGLMTKDIQRLSRKFNSYTSGQSYIVINTTDNRFFLYKNKILIREGSCSTGKLLNLKTEKGRSWVFRTPKGKRSIQGKRTNPAWHKPDWAFIEEGIPVPPKDSPLRWEANVLGDYALDIGDSYMIHGTIYQRLLGMPVTHGCVRLNDEDLEAVFNTLNVGSKVYIF